MGGGAGGIIQIISPAGHLSPKALFLKGGTSCGSCPSNAENGYSFVAGNFLWCTLQKYVKIIDLNSKNRGQCSRGKRSKMSEFDQSMNKNVNKCTDIVI